jgi:formate dehydrogenase major subunit
MNAPSKKEALMPRLLSFSWMASPPKRMRAKLVFKAAQRHGVSIPHLCYRAESGPMVIAVRV